MRFRLALALLFLVMPLPAVAATPAAKAALAVTDSFIVPLYRGLSQAADLQVRTWHDVCLTTRRGRDVMLRGAYQPVSDRWARIEFIKSGPILLFFRHERFNYWPELRNATGRGLDALLASNDPKALVPATLAHDSIPAQGLPALERLLYDPAYANHPRRCAVGEAIASNLAAIAHDVLNEWIGPNGVRAAIAANRGWNNNLFANADEAARMLLTDLVGGFTAMNDQKLLVPMGANAAAAKPHAAEAWRSGRTAYILAFNIDALRAMERAFAADIPAPAKARLERAFDAAAVAVKALPDDIPAALGNPAQRPKFEAARAALKGAL